MSNKTVFHTTIFFDMLFVVTDDVRCFCDALTFCGVLCPFFRPEVFHIECPAKNYHYVA